MPSEKLAKTDAEWRKQLTADEFAVCRRKATEPPFTGKYYHHDQPGVYQCTCCGNPLFRHLDKFDSGSGWPSFWQPISDDCVETEADDSLGMRRTEVLCSACDAHLGHVFNDGPAPTGLRYCINSVALRFRPDEDGSTD